MEKAKQAVSDFMHKAGHHDTTVHETVAPGVTHETVKPHQHENVTTAVDKEVHQDHYHRTVQPVQDREILPEQHTAKLGAVQHREFDHRDHDHTKRALVEDQSGFRDKSVTQDTTHTQTAAPAVGGEHVHHHIHETIQPVVHKETIQPNVVHTTVPIHEVHHNTAKHHETSTLPPVTMDQFKDKGGVLGGREERYDGFEGEPRGIGGALGSVLGGSKHEHSKRDSHHTDPSLLRKEGQGDLNPLDGNTHSSEHRAAEGVLGGTGRHTENRAGEGVLGDATRRTEQRTAEGVRADGVPRSAAGTTGTTAGAERAL